MPSYVCPFGRYCSYGCNKTGQPSNVCWWFFIGECSDEERYYDKQPSQISSGLLKKKPGVGD